MLVMNYKTKCAAMDIWNDTSKQKPPKHVLINAKYGDTIEKMIFTGKKYFSETNKTYTNDQPDYWMVKTI